MEITRNVILDLLPLYSANEVSADTRVLVEEYLKTDPELANIAKQLETMEKPRDIPVPLSRDAIHTGDFYIHVFQLTIMNKIALIVKHFRKKIH